MGDPKASLKIWVAVAKRKQGPSDISLSPGLSSDAGSISTASPSQLNQIEV